jgi:DNA helicase II / ATP-dependent DNA helicase PcrA
MSREYVLRSFRSPVELQINYAKELNEQQFAAVTAPPGPSLVIAGAGSGKTRTLTYRVAYLLEQGVPPERLLLLTFTNKAAREMMRRVSDLVGRELQSLWGGTFHSIGNRVLRRHADRVGYGRDFSILDSEDARHLVAACLKELESDITASRFPKAEVLADIFSMSVNTEKAVPVILEEQHKAFLHWEKEIGRVQAHYVERKRAMNAVDFDDLLLLWLRLLREDELVREEQQYRFQFVLVDEYQDTNRLQSDIIDLVAARERNLMVVGDDAQSIYAWRGANYQNIFRFPERYPEAKIYRIETNYRSTPEILHTANAAIAANTQQFAKELTAARKSGLRPLLVPCRDTSVQARFVAQRVLELRDEGVSLKSVAVLYRSHFHALELQLELTKRHIPFVITSGIRFFEQAHIKDVAAYLRLISNPRDELAFKRLVLMLPGVGPKAADKLWRAFVSERLRKPASPAAPGKGATDNADNTAEESPTGTSEPVPPRAQSSAGMGALLEPRLAERLQRAGTVPKKITVAWAQFVATMAQLETAPREPSEMLRLVIEATYEDYLKITYENYRSRLEDVQQLAVFARDFEHVEEFLAQLALMTSVEAEDNRAAARTDDEQLRLSTIHQAKGLEFDVVFVIMLCEGAFPNARALETPGGLEEERRLMYVAITRARNELYLCYPLVRFSYGSSGSGVQETSRFIFEIPPELLEECRLRYE